MKSTLT